MTPLTNNNSVLDDMSNWLQAFVQPTVLIELGALAVCVALAWGIVTALSRGLRQADSRSILFGTRVVDGALFPIMLLGLGYLARTLLVTWVPLAAFKVVGASTLSVRTMIEGTLTAGAVLLLALWISAAIEARLLRSATGGELSLRKAVSNAVRALLVFVGLIMALSAVGIDLTALSVLGGAVGVGIGFGLQKLAANYVSGFVILAERSMRIGDNVKLDAFEGRITQINARYTVIRSPSGRESIVPNELLITQRVENLSLSDPRVWMSTVVSVAYDSDVDLVTRLLSEAALVSPRVLRDPAPSAALSAFGADGLEFTLGFWIADPENGSLGLRSAINRAILDALRSHQIEIPYPQRVMHVQTHELPLKQPRNPSPSEGNTPSAA